MAEELNKYLATQADRIEWMFKLGAIVKATGECVLRMEPEAVSNTVEVRQHQFSTVDATGMTKLRQTVERELPDFVGTVLEESDITSRQIDQATIRYPLLLADVVEGSINARRWLASRLQTTGRRPALAGTSAMLLEKTQLGSVAASAFFDFDSQCLITSMRSEAGSYLAFINGMLQRPSLISPVQGDSQNYVIVPGYSNTNVEARGRVEQVLIKEKLWVTGGSRSSAQDLLNIMWNQADAYVDLRAFFPGKTESQDELLRAWDVGSLLPIMDALGFHATDARTQQSWQEWRFDDRLALIVARPTLWPTITKAIGSLDFVQGISREPSIYQIPPQSIGG